MRDYLALGSVRLLGGERAEGGNGVVGKSGRPLGRGALFHMLQETGCTAARWPTWARSTRAAWYLDRQRESGCHSVQVRDTLRCAVNVDGGVTGMPMADFERTVSLTFERW